MIDPIKIEGVTDRGIGNSERVVMRAQTYCDLGHYWIGLGMRQSQNSVFPINDNLFWLGKGLIQPGDWIFLYTGWGQPTTTDIPSQTNKIYTFYWKRDRVLFQSPEIFPYLINAPRVGLPNEMYQNALPSPNE
ncbi:hypothetical protein [Roseovarius sp. EL26]|uniref:hypothetical protein n=1 Tax=Roseovarius sp. EL26 TaxID=2126672 RepID=UPI0013C51DB0|nr:hypothetical protein [Roseovarius sp. EL26]